MRSNETTDCRNCWIIQETPNEMLQIKANLETGFGARRKLDVVQHNQNADLMIFVKFYYFQIIGGGKNLILNLRDARKKKPIPFSLTFVHFPSFSLVASNSFRSAQSWKYKFESMTNLAISQQLRSGVTSSSPCWLRLAMPAAKHIVNTSILCVPFIPTQALQRLYQWHNYIWLPNMIACNSQRENFSGAWWKASGARSNCARARAHKTPCTHKQSWKIKRCFQ